jgi:signal transduction histidine kinase
VFKKLRNSFLLSNTLLTTSVVLIALLAILIVNYNTTMQSEWRRLDEFPIADIFAVDESTIEISGDADSANTTTTQSPDGTKVEISQSIFERYLAFKFDETGRIIAQQTNTALTTVDMLPAIAHLEAKDNYSGQCNIADRTWLYKIEAYYNLPVTIDDSDLHIDTSEYDKDSTLYFAVFTDITDSAVALQTMMLTLALAALILVAAIFLLSLLFANRSVKPIQAAWEQQQQFIADASHELKTPLAVMATNFDVLVSDPEQTIASQQQWLDNLSTGMDRMSKLTNDLLRLERIESSSFAAQKTSVDLKALVGKQLVLFAAIADSKQIRLEFDSANTALPAIESDPQILEQIVNTLFDNAFKYTPEGGWINIGFSVEQRRVMLSVSNSGDGIAEQELEHIFDRFYRSDEARTGEAAGFGLGLAIAQRLAASIGADISVTSVAGESATFNILI